MYSSDMSRLQACLSHSSSRHVSDAFLDTNVIPSCYAAQQTKRCTGRNNAVADIWQGWLSRACPLAFSWLWSLLVLALSCGRHALSTLRSPRVPRQDTIRNGRVGPARGGSSLHPGYIGEASPCSQKRKGAPVLRVSCRQCNNTSTARLRFKSQLRTRRSRSRRCRRRLVVPALAEFFRLHAPG